MKITKQQLKQIIKEELDLLEAEMVVHGGRNPKNTAPWSQRYQTAGRFDVRDKIQGLGPQGEMTRFPYIRKHVPASEEELAKMDPVQRWFNQTETALHNSSGDAIHALLLQTMIRVILVYAEEKKLPPAIKAMAKLAIERKYADIRSDFNKIWTDLVQYHRDRGDPGLQPIVVHNLRSINSMIRSV